ncbi:MAG TPA: proteasome activator [Acidimicrobiia bacterium]|nr:proteasome activator [Acidimicrobiia bacterium]
MTDGNHDAADEAPERADVEIVDAAQSSPDGDAQNGPDESVSHPSKLIRIASMVRQMLEEVRQSPLDEQGRRRLREIHDRALDELGAVLSENLREELSDVVIPFESDTPTESELRISQAQLVGWLEGLFHGIQATIFSQQLTMQQQLEEMRRQRAIEAAQEGQARTGPYL